MFSVLNRVKRVLQADVPPSFESIKWIDWRCVPELLKGFSQELENEQRIKAGLSPSGPTTAEERIVVRLGEIRKSRDHRHLLLQSERPFECKLSSLLEAVVAEAILEDKGLLAGAWRERLRLGHPDAPTVRLLPLQMILCAHEIFALRGSPKRQFQIIRAVEAPLDSKARALLSSILFRRLLVYRSEEISDSENEP